ncbi:MAG: hypothetical protein V1872_07465 [bacterium]
MEKNIKQSISKIAIVVDIIVFLFTSFVTAMPGCLVSIFIFIAIIALIPILIGTKKFKIVGIILLLIASLCLMNEYKNGKEFEAKTRKKIETAIETDN